jgi:ABC-type amino acid transport system permease subunit
MSGGTFAGNNAKGTGGGVLVTGRYGYKENGVKKEDVPYVEIHGGTFTENNARNGGAFLIQAGATLKVTGGTFTRVPSKYIPVYCRIKDNGDSTYTVLSTYTLTFQAGDGTGTMAPVSVRCGSSVKLPACGFKAQGSKDFAGWLIGGIPTVLLLMVLYYLIFVGWASLDGTWVAIICFAILFGYAVFEILSTSVSAIGKGQEEGARALGYNSTQTFFHVILPQALRVAFPQIKSELVSLIKETSIVGYISIADLTRMSDIVRGRTYEAFFPLITTTVIYFGLIWLILFVVKRVEIQMTFRPLRIEKIKRGINIQ